MSTLAKTPEKLVDWLWPSWLPAGKLVSCDGDPDDGDAVGEAADVIHAEVLE